MKFNLQRFADFVEDQTEPEPFSGVVYLTQGEDILFERAYGLAVRSESIPNRVGTRFQMASGCKVFTSTAICQLVERGKPEFDTLLSNCVDVTFPEYAPDITICHLLTHRSGIASYFKEDIETDYEAVWRDVPVYKMRGPRDFLPLFRHKPMKFQPGERFEYNDAGYILLGLVIECVTDMSFPAYIEENIFRPAGMKDSGYFPADRLPTGTAYAYIKNPDGTWRTNFFTVPVIGGPDGGAYTTAPDMARFWKMLTGTRLLNIGTTEQLLKVRIATGWKPPYTHYGYGVWIEQHQEKVRKLFVEGSDPGVAMRSAYYPDTDIILTIIGNTGDALWPMYGKIEKILGL